MTGKVVLLLSLIISFVNGWKWNCETGICKRGLTGKYPTLEICHLVCHPHGNIWPLPTNSLTKSSSIVFLDVKNVNFISTHGVGDFLKQIIQYFQQNTIGKYKNCQKSTFPLTVDLQYSSENEELMWSTNENYTLTFTMKGSEALATVQAETLFGIRHGLETLIQFLVPYPLGNTTCVAALNFFQVEDGPVYPHRGILIDTARNFLEKGVLLKQIDGMAASKLNVLHWHMTDSQSFPLYLENLINMTNYGAYGKDKVYKFSDIDYIINYAKVRGVRIIIEIDGPAHIGSGWQWFPEAGFGNVGVCIFAQPWRDFCIQPPCGQLNPANPEVYKILNLIYKYLTNLLPNSEAFHLGGDEVFIPCWNSSQEIINYLNNNRTTEAFHKLWAEFHKKSSKEYDEAAGNAKTSFIIWTSSLTDPSRITSYLDPKRYIIQTWVESSSDLPKQLLNLGYKLIMSTKNSWYLDHGTWGSTKYYNWRTVYTNRILRHPNVLGGEVCMWTELVDKCNIDSKIWPRAAAAGERLWSNPSLGSAEVESRFFLHNDRITKRGIASEAVTPRWCVQNPQECNGYLFY